MKDAPHAICREALEDAQAEARTLGVSRQMTMEGPTLRSKLYAAYTSRWQPNPFWTGQACCKFHARAQALQERINAHHQKT